MGFIPKKFAIENNTNIIVADISGTGLLPDSSNQYEWVTYNWNKPLPVAHESGAYLYKLSSDKKKVLDRDYEQDQIYLDWHLNKVLDQREQAYRAESDKLFLEWQFEKEQGSAIADDKKQVWLDKVNEIKTRFPKK